MRAVKIVFGVLCFGLGVAFVTGAVNILVHPAYVHDAMHVALPSIFGAIFLFGSFLLLRNSAPPPSNDTANRS
jgi:hypothetical protein